jgi:hypothetical protein
LKAAELRANVSDFETAGELRDLLVEVLQLLDEYGPSWYSEELHDRIVNALVKIRQ